VDLVAEKVLFNRRVRKVEAKDAKLNYCMYYLCDLCLDSLRPLRLMDFCFFDSYGAGGNKVAFETAAYQLFAVNKYRQVFAISHEDEFGVW